MDLWIASCHHEAPTCCCHLIHRGHHFRRTSARAGAASGSGASLVHDPLIVFAAPRPGFHIGTAVRFRLGVRIGDAFEPWGWGGSAHLEWPSHVVIVSRTPWQRTLANRTTYVHPYTVPRYEGAKPIEQHQLKPRTAHERDADHKAPKHH